MTENRRSRWDERYRAGDWLDDAAPAGVLAAGADWLPGGGRAVDLASGAGRNALFLGRRGLTVAAVDLSIEGLRVARRRARAEDLPVHPVLADLEDFELRSESLDVAVCTYFLFRPLFERIRRALAPGGVVLYETYNVDEIDLLGGDIRRKFALERGELRDAFSGFDVLSYEEGVLPLEEGDRGLARLVGRKPTEGPDG